MFTLSQMAVINMTNTTIVFFVLCIIVITFSGYLYYLLYSARKNQRQSPFTEDILRSPGHSVRLELELKSVKLLELYIVYIGGSFLALLCFGTADTIVFKLLCLFVFIGLTVYAFKKLPALFKDVSNHRLGTEAEQYSGAELNMLMRSGAFVFHDIPYKYGNIDHIVVGNKRAFAIETKAVSKPKDIETESHVVKFDGKQLQFPHFMVTEPIEQARRHAKHLESAIQKRCGVRFPVMPVVSLPGWKIEINSSGPANILIINPKRGGPLRKWLGDLSDKRTRDLVAEYVNSVARSAPSSRKTDSDASEHYDFWMNPKKQEKLLEDI